jgi:hypothetical protein
MTTITTFSEPLKNKDRENMSATSHSSNLTPRATTVIALFVHLKLTLIFVPKDG